jgi:hypothetical protein
MVLCVSCGVALATRGVWGSSLGSSLESRCCHLSPARAGPRLGLRTSGCHLGHTPVSDAPSRTQQSLDQSLRADAARRAKPKPRMFPSSSALCLRHVRAPLTPTTRAGASAPWGSAVSSMRFSCIACSTAPGSAALLSPARQRCSPKAGCMTGRERRAPGGGRRARCRVRGGPVGGAWCRVVCAVSKLEPQRSLISRRGERTDRRREQITTWQPMADGEFNLWHSESPFVWVATTT